MYVTCVYTPGIADVQKPGRVHMGCLRPKINDAAVVYWRLNLQHRLIITTVCIPWVILKFVISKIVILKLEILKEVNLKLIIS